MNSRSIDVFLKLLLIIFLISSCSKQRTIHTLDFPPTPMVSATERFALVIDPYISMRDTPGDNGITIAHGRRGEIFPVLGKRLLRAGKNNYVWVDLGKGWVIASSIQFFSSPEKAQSASKGLE